MTSQGETPDSHDNGGIQYKVIDGKKHLAFATIRRVVHGTLSPEDAELAAAHIGRCARCRDIWEDLANPDKAKKKGRKKAGFYRKAAVVSVVLIATALVIYFLTFDFRMPSSLSKQMSKAEAPAQEESTEDALAMADTPELEEVEATTAFDEDATPEINEEPAEQTVAYDPAPEEEPAAAAPVGATPEPTTSIATRKVYGKITLAGSGETLAGVNVMVVGSKEAKISNAIGGYNIQIPRSASELVFIYRGKKLYKKLNPNNSLVNVQLNLDEMVYD